MFWRTKDVLIAHFSLFFAESLSLDDNFLSGEIPSELGLISTLSELYVHFNEFVGEIPEDICALRPTAVGDGSKTTGLDEVWADCGDDPPQVVCIEETCCTKCFSVADADGTYAPTELPTMYPTQKAVPALSENEDFRLFLLEHMDGFEDSLSAVNKDSPQYEAYLWLANTSNFDDLDAFQRIQRWVYFAVCTLSITMSMTSQQRMF